MRYRPDDPGQLPHPLKTPRISVQPKQPVYAYNSASFATQSCTLANYNTHLGGALLVSSFAATGTLSTGLASPGEALLLWLAGTLGGLLPDVDADKSRAMRNLFTLLGVGGAFLAVSWFHASITTLELWFLAGASYLLIRYPLMWTSEHFTVHRGSIHSLSACVLFGLAATNLTHLLGQPPLVAWLTGLFITGGMLVHLLLDEFYSVNLANVSVKRSFGTALKIIDRRYPVPTTVQLAMIAVLLIIGLTPDSFFSALDEWQRNAPASRPWLPVWLQQLDHWLAGWIGTR